MGALAQLEPGHLIDNKYIVESLLGRGGMSQVYRAKHRLTDRLVALKWVASGDPHKQARLLREARSISKINHPNVVEILDAGECDGAVYMAMNYVAGIDLRRYARGRRFAPAEAVRLLEPALDGVEAAHRAGFIHRDIKPANLLVCLDDDQRPLDTKVLDFGVAKALHDDHDSRLTRTGTIVGTPKYMAPEQIMGEPEVDFSTDIYALTLVLYELVTGNPPFARSSEEGLARDIVLGRLIPPGQLAPQLPEALCRAIELGTAPGQAGRLASVSALRTALQPFHACGDGPRELSRPASFFPQEGTATVVQADMALETEVCEGTENRLSLSATHETEPLPTRGRSAPGRSTYWFLGAAALLLLAWNGLPTHGGLTPDAPRRLGQAPTTPADANQAVEDPVVIPPSPTNELPVEAAPGAPSAGPSPELAAGDDSVAAQRSLASGSAPTTPPLHSAVPAVPVPTVPVPAVPVPGATVPDVVVPDATVPDATVPDLPVPTAANHPASERHPGSADAVRSRAGVLRAEDF